MKPGHHPKRDTNGGGHEYWHHGAGQRHPSTPQDTAENIPPLAIHAQKMPRGANGGQS